MKVVFILIGLDIILGLSCAFINKELNSRFGLMGVIKHSVVVVLLLTFKYITTEYNVLEYFNMFLIFYILQYSFSILEHVYKMDIPIPEFLVTRLKVYEEREGLGKWEK